MNSKKVLTYFLPWFLWLCLIFFLSSMPKDDSKQLSEWVLQLLSFFSLDIETLREYGITLLIRKLAHMTEYFILALLTLRLFSLKFTWNQLAWISLGFCFLYAASDEYHQTFVYGRVGTPVDVMIDTFGASLGILAAYIWKRRQTLLHRN